jgi:hypothetical protein
MYRYNSLPPVWDQGAFIPPLLPLETAAVRITGKRNKAQAMAALEKFMPAWLEELANVVGLVPISVPK